MEEEECDYSSPIGQKIKQINALFKKPKLDEELGLALDVFHDKITKQRVYLKNGIFNINFAEAALFLQSCANLYGKKVDLLWDQLLEFHTRLIEYDCEHEKEKGKNMDTEVIQQLEERRNRYKRKKKFKLVLSCDDNIDEFLFDKPLPPIENTFDSDDEVLKKWKKLEWKSAKIKSIPNAVYKQQLTMYRMKNYYIMKHQNYDIYDTEDGEFNIKYGRIPGWHFIQHLFEYNEKGLLPDKNNLIATLRLGAYLRLAFMRDNKIPLNSEYNIYKDRYLEFKKKFFEEEAKKWQNMPLNTMEDLHKQLQYLAEKERETLRQRNPESNSCPFPVPNKKLSGIIHCCDDTSEDSKSSEGNDIEKFIGESDTDSLFELSFNSDSMSKSGLCIRLERMSSDIISKSRQDSGFFERVSDIDDDLNKDEEFTGDGNNNQIEKDLTTDSDRNKSAENNAPNEGVLVENFQVTPENDGTIGNSTIPSASVDDLVTLQKNPENSHMLPTIIDSEHSKENTVTNVTPCQENAVCDQNKENVDPNSDEVDDFDTRSIVSDHSYCRTPITRNIQEVNNVLGKRSARTKKNQSSPYVSSLTMVIPRAIRIPVLKEKNVKEEIGQENYPSPAKRRKLSQKQLEKLLDKMIVLPTVKENKFEHFFSKNYQPQLGEGEIQEMDYESDSDAEDNFAEPLPVGNAPAANVPPPPSDRDQENDTQSIFSDHNYSQPAENNSAEPVPAGETAPFAVVNQEHDAQSVISDHNYSQPIDDSGFLDGTVCQNEELDDQIESPAMAAGDSGAAEGAAENVDPHEEEYQRLLKALRDSRRSMNEEIEATPEELKTELQRREQERRESRARVDQWKDTINPIIRNLHETDFNIHDYGSSIMEGMEVNQSKPFASIVEGKSSAEVVRYFIASLQLANTYNIEICGAKKGELSNDSYNVKLLKHDRYHEHLTDYQAPSEETFRERLKRVRTIRDEKENHASESQTKKQRLSETPKRERQSRPYSTANLRKSAHPSPQIRSSIADEPLSSMLGPQATDATSAQDPMKLPLPSKGAMKPSQPNALKGKSIVKVVAPRSDDSHLTAPSTSCSGHVYWPDSSEFSCDSNFSATEESFMECLMSKQLQNPDIQVSSTPKGTFA